MTMKVWTLDSRCPVCHRDGSNTFEEPQHDQSGKHTRAIEVTGCWTTGSDGRPVNRCVTPK